MGKYDRLGDWFYEAYTFRSALTLTINGTIMTPAAEAINASFGMSDEFFPNSYWPVTSWALGGAVAVVVALPLLEDVGVQKGYFVGKFAPT